MPLSDSPLARVIAVLSSLALFALGCSEDSNAPVGGAVCVGDTAVFIPSIGGESDSIAVAGCAEPGARISWQAEESADWFAVAPASGTTPGWFRIVADRNESTAERRDTVFVRASGAPGAPKTVAVVQGPPGPYLCVTPESYAFSTPGGLSAPFAVTNCGNDASIPWIVSCAVDWLSATETSGTTPGGFMLSALPNTSGADRSTTVIVYDPDALSISRLLGITQTFSRFSGSRYYPVDAAVSRIGAGDFDRDGDTDIVGHASDTGILVLLRNIGDGSFVVEGGYGLGPEYVKQMAVADLSGDGYPDLLFSRDLLGINPYYANLCYVENAGAAGGFEEGVYALVPGDIVEILTGDLDGDGDADIAYLAQRYDVGKPLLGVLLNKGGAAFLGPYEYELMVQPECGDLGDVDGDGDLDVLLNGEGTFVIMENNGAGSFSWLGNSQQLADASDLALGDFDGDGDSDCAAALPATGSIIVMRNLGDGSYNVAAVIHGTDHMADLRAADVTGDGFDDIVWGDSFVQSSLFVQESGGTLIDWSIKSYAVLRGGRGLVLGDIDADGDLDAVLASAQDGYVTVLRNYSR